jgi:hypothetical protein
MLAFCIVCLLGVEFTWLRILLHTLINTVITTYTVSSRFQKIGTHFVDCTNMRFLYVPSIFYNVLTNFLPPLVLFIPWQGSVLQQCVISCAFYGRMAKCPLFITKVFSSVPQQCGTRYGCQLGLTSHHWIKNCQPLLAGLHSSPVTSGNSICKPKLAKLDTVSLPAIYIQHFLYPSTHISPPADIMIWRSYCK